MSSKRAKKGAASAAPALRRTAGDLVILDLLHVILGDKTQELPGYLPRVIDGVPHLRTCRIGQWVDGYHGPLGAPCSSTCVRVREHCDRALDYLQAPAMGRVAS